MKERDKQAERKYGNKNGALASPRRGLWDDIFYLSDLLPTALSAQNLTKETLLGIYIGRLRKTREKLASPDSNLRCEKNIPAFVSSRGSPRKEQFDFGDKSPSSSMLMSPRP